MLKTVRLIKNIKIKRNIKFVHLNKLYTRFSKKLLIKIYNHMFFRVFGNLTQMLEVCLDN